MDTVSGYVERITFRNEENGYTVLTLQDAGKETVLTGVFPAVSEGEFIRAEGEIALLAEILRQPVPGEEDQRRAAMADCRAVMEKRRMKREQDVDEAALLAAREAFRKKKRINRQEDGT